MIESIREQMYSIEIDPRIWVELKRGTGLLYFRYHFYLRLLIFLLCDHVYVCFSIVDT